MASSSSSSRCYKYDVFLSFRGEDTRKNLVSHLHSELLRKGITTFKDDRKLECGDSISLQLPVAIQESRLSIVVISKNYASSRWCLDELEMIIECKKRGQLTVVPVFYEVDPSDVRNQRGSFADAFKKYGDPDMAGKVQKWRAALTEVASITGVDSRTWMDEARTIQKLVKDISHKLFSFLSIDNKDLVGIETHMEAILHLLRMELNDDDIRMIGIWGMGGIGKTTIAEHLYNMMFHRFQSHCFISNVKEISRLHGLLGLQEQLLLKILDEEDIKLWSMNLGSEAIKARLRHQKVLIVLDDVDKSDQLDALVKEPSWFGPGSVIIITTRDKHLLVAHAVELVYEVKCLGEDDALQLFGQFAFKNKLPADDFQKLSIHATKLAQGLPLALKVFGSFLCGRSKEEWENALGRLERNLAPDIMEVLKISYDGLDERDKAIFLHVACLFNWVHVNHLTKLIGDDEADIDFGIKVLAEKSLIQVLTNGLVVVHGLLKKMGRELVRQQSVKEPGKRQFLLDSQEIYNVLTESTGTEAVEGLSLTISEKTEMFQLGNLKRMDLGNSISLKEVPNLSRATNLETLSLTGCESLVELPVSIKSLNKLTSLCMEGCTKLKRMPSNINLKALQTLNLNGCSRLKDFPGISQNIKRLYLRGTKIEQVPESVGHLSGLVELDMSHCKRLRNFPKTIQKLKSLEILLISGSRCITEFPHLPENIARLQLSETGIEEVPSWINNVSCLQELIISENKSLKSISPRISELRCLECLDLRGCSKVESFPSEICETTSPLKYLFLTGTTIKELSGNFGNLQTLMFFLAKETAIDRVPSSISRLTCLTKLLLGRNCYKSDGLPFQCPLLSNFTVLNDLSLSNLNMTEVPNHLWHLPNLMYLELSGNDFKTLPASIKQLTTLKELYLDQCKKLQSLPELPPGLQYLYARNCLLLEKISQVFKLSFLTLSFRNCFKMDLDAELLAQHMSSLPRKEKAQRIASFPGGKMPAFFNHRNKGPSLTIRLPQSRLFSELESFVACFVVAVKGRYNSNEYTGERKSVGFGCCLRDTSSGEVFHSSPWSYNTYGLKNMDFESDHLILFRRDISWEEDSMFDEFTLVFCHMDFIAVPLPLSEVKECGVRLLFKEDVKEECEATATVPSHPSQGQREAVSSAEPVGIENVVNAEGGDGMSAKNGDGQQQKPNSKGVKFFQYLSSKIGKTTS